MKISKEEIEAAARTVAAWMPGWNFDIGPKIKPMKGPADSGADKSLAEAIVRAVIQAGGEK